MNNRLKEIRNSLNISQEEFGEKILLARSHISSLENGARELTDRVINDICREYGINEDWLRFGEGEMFIEPDTFSLDDYAKSKGLTALEYDIVKGFMELDPMMRRRLLDHFKSIFNKHSETSYTQNLYVAEELEAYKSELEAEQKGEILSVSEDIEDTKKA